MYENCNGCGKRIKIGSGNWTTWGGKYPQGIFLCNRCIRQLEKEEARAKLEPFRKIAAEWAKTEPTPKPEEIENKAMVQTLREMCPIEGWYRLIDIKAKMRWKGDVREVGKILNRLGFKERKRMGGGYTGVWINPKNLEGKSKSQT